MADKKQSLWQKCTEMFTCDSTKYALLNGINKSDCFVFVKQKGLYRYDFDTNTWHKYDFIDELPNNFDTDWDYDEVTVTIDINTKKLYFLNRSGAMRELLIIDNNKNECNITKTSIDAGYGTQAIIIERDYYLIGGSMSNKHLKYNVELNKFDVIHTFKEFETGFCFHRIASFNNNIFVFGGYDTRFYEKLDTIYHGYVVENIWKWNKLNIKMAKQLHSFGCSTAINNQYILLFGGIDEIYQSDEIYIFSLLNQSFTKSKIHCPEKGLFHAITISDRIRDEMAVDGYVREQWILCQISNHYFPAAHLLKIIHCYYRTEWIHLIHNDLGKHWKINSFDIVS